MARIKFTKEDINKAFDEAVNTGLSQTKPGQRPGGFQAFLDKVKSKIPGRLGEGEQ